MKQFWKRLTAAALSVSLVTAGAGAVTMDGESETWFDAVMDAVRGIGLKGESTDYAVQNLVNAYIAAHPEQEADIINTVLSQLDTHSMYLSAEDYTAGFGTVAGYIGIGVGVQEIAGGVQVSEVVRFSAAEQAGLQAGDVFVSIDGHDCTGMDATGIGALLRGEAGTAVQLIMRRQGREITISCTRALVNQIYVSNQTLAEGVEYIKISAFGSENDWTVFNEIWNTLDDKKTKALILDLRGNGGGVVDVARKVIDSLTPKAELKIATEYWRADQGGAAVYTSSGTGLPLNKIVVLVDENTASAAELCAGALRDVDGAQLIGVQTYGKAQGQFHLDLTNGDKLVLTVMELELPRAGRYEGIGLKPDLVVENQTVTVNVSELKPLNTNKTLYFGETSDDVYAMTERLARIGMIDQAHSTFDSETLEAVGAFLAAYEMPSALCASPTMLQQLDGAMQTLDGKTFQLDTQFETALAICKLAAREDLRYVPLPDGSWRAK